MKHFTVLLIIASILFACSEDNPANPLPPTIRPGVPSSNGYPDIFFAAENASEMYVGDEDGALHIILYREAGGLTKPQSCLLVLTEGSDFASIDNQVDFAVGSSTANIVLRYSPARMGAKQRTATVKMADSDKSISIRFIKEESEWADGGEMLMFDGSSLQRMDSKYRLRGDMTEWIIGTGAIMRHFTVKGSLPEVIAEGDIMPAASYGKADRWPGVLAEACFNDDFIALNICTLRNGSADFPHTEYFFRRPGKYAVATVCDGWLLPVIAINAKLLNPEENKWNVPARINDDGSVSVFGPYHNGSPLHSVNACGLAETWLIDIKGDRANLAPQFSGFRNGDVFDFDLMIAAEGLCDSGLSKIVFESPLHNCNADGIKNITVDCSWGKPAPTVIEMNTPIDF